MNRVQLEDVQEFVSSFVLADELRGSSFLITGATGLIGSVMVKCLVALNRRHNLGLRIVAVIRDLEKAKRVFNDEFSEIVFKRLSLNDVTIDNIGAEIDYVVHLASPTASKYFVDYPVETLRTAIEGTTSVLEYVKNVGVKAMVYASSLEVYGGNDTDGWLDEDFQGNLNPLDTRSSYNMGKRAAECLCHAYAEEYNVPVMMARMTQTFGAGVEYNDNRVFAQFARKVIERRDIELHTTGETCRMYCYTTDAVSAMLYILIKGQRGVAYNVANKDTYISIRDMAQFVRDLFNKDISVVIAPKDDQGYAPQTKLRLSTDKLESLGWHPIYGLKEMFERLIDSMKIAG